MFCASPTRHAALRLPATRRSPHLRSASSYTLRTIRSVPTHLYITALGPTNVAATAEVADDWISVFCHPDKAGSVRGGASAASLVQPGVVLSRASLVQPGVVLSRA